MKAKSFSGTSALRTINGYPFIRLALISASLGISLIPSTLSATPFHSPSTHQDAVAFTTEHDLPYLAADRKERLDLYLPAKTEARSLRPALVWIHGGGWQGGDKRNAMARSIGSTFAKAGYVVASPNYLLATLEQPSWPLALWDCKNAVRFLRANAEKYCIDPERIAVMGGSAGGHLALMVAFTHGNAALSPQEPQSPYPNTSDKVRAVVNFYGITNLLTRQRVKKDGTPTGVLHPGSSYKFTGRKRDEGAEIWRDASPTTHINPGIPPVFIIHGKRDATVDYLQAIELAARLKEARVPHQFELLENAGHEYGLGGFSKKVPERDVTPELLQFLAQHLE